MTPSYSKNIVLVFISISLTLSCATLKAGIYLSSIDSNSGTELLQNEPNVKAYLENILLHPQNYKMYTFSRRSIAYNIPKTKLLSHDYYVIYEFNDTPHTLSFYGSRIEFRSEGMWVLDSDSDFGSFTSFLNGENNWNVEETTPANGIDVGETVFNIIKKIDSNVTYYYRDHIKDKPNVDNCITALRETRVENDRQRGHPRNLASGLHDSATVRNVVSTEVTQSR
jgi:hypothetical protein